LRVRNWIDDEQFNSGVASNRGTNPDRYRALVMPAVPSNFRVESMRWATDKSGNKLMYRISLKEYARPLPYPAKKGTGRFTYQRSLGNLLGVKMFDGELEGDTNSNPKELLNSLIRIAASRIRFGGSSATPGEDSDTANDLIQSVTVTENDIFSKKSISLRIVAQGMQTLSRFGVENDPDGGSALGFNMLSPFFEADDLSVADRPNSHGASLIQSVKRQMYLPWNPNESSAWEDTNFPKALWRRADEWSGEDIALSVEDTVFEKTTPPPEVGKGEHADDSIENTGQVENPYALVSGTESVTYKSNAVVMSGQSLSALDVVYQTAKPIVLIESEYRVSRLGLPPKRFMLNKPKNGVVLEETFDVNRGDVDANNNRNYIGVYRRVVRLLDNGEIAGFYNSSFTLPGWGTVEMRAWWPPNGLLASPADPRFEGRTHDVGETVRALLVLEEGGPGSTNGEGQVYKLGEKPSIYG